MTAQKLDRRAVLARLTENRTDLIMVASLGSPTYDLSAVGDHQRNFYLWGAMGGAALVGLGLAIAQPEVPVAVLVGDGEALMGMGALATVALQKPGNLSIIVLDNGLYGETGAQPSHTSSYVSFAAVARGCGIAEAVTVTAEAELDAHAARIHRIGDGPFVLVVKIAGEEKPRHLPSRDGVWLKARLRASLGLASM